MLLRTRYNLLLFGMVIFDVVLILLAVETNHPEWAIPIFVAVAIFGIWGNTLKCPVCKTSYLYKKHSGLMVPQRFPDKCSGCGRTLTSC